jgi:hypothetical protein
MRRCRRHEFGSRRPTAWQLAAKASKGRPALRLQMHRLGQHDCAGYQCRERYDGDDAEYGSQYRVAEDDEHGRQCDRCFKVTAIAL